MLPQDNVEARISIADDYGGEGRLGLWLRIGNMKWHAHFGLNHEDTLLRGADPLVQSVRCWMDRNLVEFHRKQAMPKVYSALEDYFRMVVDERTNRRLEDKRRAEASRPRLDDEALDPLAIMQNGTTKQKEEIEKILDQIVHPS